MLNLQESKVVFLITDVIVVIFFMDVLWSLSVGYRCVPGPWQPEVEECREAVQPRQDSKAFEELSLSGEGAMDVCQGNPVRASGLRERTRATASSFQGR